LRLMATEQETPVHVTVRSGDSVVMETDAPLEAATPTEISLEELDPGVYSIDVEAEASVVGAVRQTTRAGAASDFAWMTSAPNIRGEVLTAIPEGPDPRLHLVNSGDSDATVTLESTSGGKAKEISIPAGDDAVVDVKQDTTYAIRADENVSVAVMLSGTDELAGWPVWPGAAAQEPITVYP
ncbi:MAG: DUF5719 family protein, partial [Microbacteriaceae bacterium]